MTLIADPHHPSTPRTIHLKQKGESHVIRLKSKDAAESVQINLNWQTSADLDLGCFYELKGTKKVGFLSSLLSAGDAKKSVIDGVQFSRGRGGPRHRKTAQGCYTDAPYIWHTGDDRSGQATAGESILVNPQGFPYLRRMTIYTFIYNGVARWTETDAIVTVKTPGNPDLAVHMGRQSSPKTFAAVAGLEFLDGDGVRVTKHLSFHHSHGDCDRQYGWGMSWQAGGK